MTFPWLSSSSLLLLLLLILAAAQLSAANYVDDRPLAVFETGKFQTKSLQVRQRDPSSPPRPLLVITPTISGNYPVLLFAHGTYLENHLYSSLLRHISSHGFIVVAPQLSGVLLPTALAELEFVAQVANWLPSGLPAVLPTAVEANLDKLAISGHSRGGKSAFALALGYAKTQLNVAVSALIGIDPVAGNRFGEMEPRILTNEPNSFNLSIPVAVIGTGLGSQRRSLMMPPCAPNGMNHKEFYRQSRAPAGHFVAAEYGHMDMVDDGFSGMIDSMMTNLMCKNGRGKRDPMRRSVGGIVVAFLKAYLGGESEDYVAILGNPSVAPVKLDPVQNMVPQYFASPV